jgi:biopolymer transport protein ExbD
MSGSTPGGESVQPNLTPILDMVFQLITFFMLVINFKAEETDRRLRLPVVGSARPVDSKVKDRLLVLNVMTQDAVDDTGKKVKRPAIRWYRRVVPKEEIEALIVNEMMGSLMKANLTQSDIEEGGKELPDLVVIRADESCPFIALDYIIEKCQKHGFRRFGFKAYRSPDDQKKGTDASGG